MQFQVKHRAMHDARSATRKRRQDSFLPKWRGLGQSPI